MGDDEQLTFSQGCMIALLWCIAFWIACVIGFVWLVSDVL